MKKKKILLVVTRPIYPLNGGDRRRIDLLVRVLSSLGELEIIINSLWFDELEETKRTLSQKGINFKIYKIYFKNFLANSIRAIFSKHPIQNIIYRNNEIKAAIPWNEYDLVVCHLSRAESLIPKNHKNTIIDLTDNLLIHYSRVKFNWTLKSILFLLERRRFVFYYKHLNEKFKYSVISQRDKLDDGNIIIRNDAIHYGSLHDPNSKNILFIGNMNSYPNQQAVNSFIANNNDLFSSQKYSLYILGNGANKFCSKNNYRNIQAIENYKTLFDINITFKYALAPMLSGAGLQNKIIDYIGCSLPTIGTDLAFDSFPPNDVLFIKENNLEQYQHIISSPKGRSSNELEKSSKIYLEYHFSFKAILQHFQSSMKTEALN